MEHIFSPVRHLEWGLVDTDRNSIRTSLSTYELSRSITDMIVTLSKYFLILIIVFMLYSYFTNDRNMINMDTWIVRLLEIQYAVKS